MANPNKAKGTRHETDIVNYLNDEGLSVYRPAPGGPRDTGDIHGLPDFAIQAKNWKNVADAVREGTDGAEKQRENLGVPFGINIVKRPRRPISDAYVVMRLSTFVRMLRTFMPWAFREEKTDEVE